MRNAIVIVAIAGAVVVGHAQSPPLAQGHPLMGPLENVRDPLRLALTALTHAANQTCEVKKAIVNLKEAIDLVAASAMFLTAHPDARALSPIPPDVAPVFTAPPRPAPHRNEMLEGALTDLGTAFTRLSAAPGGDLDGRRDPTYHAIAASADELMTAITNANAQFRSGVREIPSCDTSDGGPSSQPWNMLAPDPEKRD